MGIAGRHDSDDGSLLLKPLKPKLRPLQDDVKPVPPQGDAVLISLQSGNTNGIMLPSITAQLAAIATADKDPNFMPPLGYAIRDRIRIDSIINPPGPSLGSAIRDCMRIDSITNPQIGGFQCPFYSCSALPFQTQYLLNSHAYVHSSNRPHICSVKGCPRGEGGKGFKRKNELIRHGLVHESPGYECPYCADGKHKYPRPDNLQRHVKVHHVGKENDSLVKDVLAQKPTGRTRNRR